MKKKLFLVTLMVAMLACIFALSVSAAGSTSNNFAETPDTIDGVAVPTTIGTTERVVLLGADGNYYTYPAYYVIADQTSATSIKINNDLNKVLGYADNTSLINYIVRIEIPSGITKINAFLGGKTNLVYVKMADTIVDIERDTFKSCSNLETLILSSNLNTIPNDFCKDCSKLTAITIPASVTVINGYCFSGCSSLKTVINYAESVTSIPDGSFQSCPIENEFNFPNSLTSIGQNAFNSAKFKRVIIPNSVTSISQGAFRYCSKITYIQLSENLTTIPHDFIGSSNLTIVISKNCTGLYSKYSIGHSTINKIIYTGSSTDSFITSLTSTHSSYLSKVEYANHCDTYYNGSHIGNFEYKFTSFVEECYTEGLCSRCNETKKNEIFAPMYKFLGYSSNGENMCSGYVINTKSIAKYESENTDVKLKYGFVVSANNDTPIDKDGVFGENVISVDLSKKEYSVVDFVLTGDFSITEYATAQIVMNLYLFIIDADGIDVNFIYGYGTEDDKIVSEIYKTPNTISFNDLNP